MAVRCRFGWHHWRYSAGATRGPREWRGCARCARAQVTAYDGLYISWRRTSLTFSEFIDIEEARQQPPTEVS